jgi:streptogramin lyase
MLDGGAQVIPANDPENPTMRPGVTLSKESTFLPYLWVVNNDQNTLSKFNTVTGLEEGRYWAGLQVSRTALDLQGDAYVVGRNDGRVTKIIARESDCIDRNMNGTIETSRRDANGAVALVNSAANPLLDECVAMSAVIDPAYPSGRGITTDASGTVWIGYSANNGAVQALDPFTLMPGMTYPATNIPAFRPDANGVVTATGATANVSSGFGQMYGLVADSRGYVYSSVRSSGTIARFNTMTRQWDMMISGFSCDMYGISVDAQDRIWVGCSSTGMVMYDPNNSKLYRVSAPAGATISHQSTSPAIIHELRAGGPECPSCIGSFGVTGVTTEPATGDIWIALYTRGHLGRLRVNNANLAASTWQYIQVPGVSGSTRGVGFDPAGFVWFLDPGTNPIYKIDPATATVLGSFPVGTGGHYGYSDFSGSLLFSFTAPRGSWTYRFDTQFAGAQVTSLEWEAFEPAGTSLGARVRAVDPQSGAPLSEWRPAPGAGNQPSYFDYPAGQPRDVVNFAPGGPLVGSSFEVEILMTTNDKNVRPILHDIRLGWSRP